MHRDRDCLLATNEAMTDDDEARVERGRQIRAARELLGWSRDRLASMAELTMTDLIHLERGTVGQRPYALEAVWRTLEAAGMEIPQARTMPPVTDRRSQAQQEGEQQPSTG